MGYGVQEKMGCRQTVGVQEYPKKDDIISEQPLNVFFTQSDTVKEGVKELIFFRKLPYGRIICRWQTTPGV